MVSIIHIDNGVKNLPMGIKRNASRILIFGGYVKVIEYLCT